MCNSSEQLSDILNSNLNDAFYRTLGSTRLLDAIYIFGISPLACVGLVFNVASFLLLCFSKQLKSNLLYKYLTVYTLNNCGICLLMSLSVLTLSPRYYPLYLSIYSRVQKCILLKMLYLTLYCVNRVLEILILLQRLANFNSSFLKFRASNILVYLCILCACTALNVPFLQMVKSNEQICTDLEAFKQTLAFTVCQNTEFYDTTFGYVIRSLALLCRECLTLCVEISMSILLIVYFRRFLASRKIIAPIVINHLTDSAENISSARQHDFSFRKTTYIITQFSISSVILNSLNFALLLIIVQLTDQVVISFVALFVVLTVIAKPFLTIILLFKIDRHFRHFIKDQFRKCVFWKR